jgi:hypothetical protein
LARFLTNFQTSEVEACSSYSGANRRIGRGFCTEENEGSQELGLKSCHGCTT